MFFFKTLEVQIDEARRIYQTNLRPSFTDMQLKRRIDQLEKHTALRIKPTTSSTSTTTATTTTDIIPSNQRYTTYCYITNQNPYQFTKKQQCFINNFIIWSRFTTTTNNDANLIRCCRFNYVTQETKRERWQIIERSQRKEIKRR